MRGNLSLFGFMNSIDIIIQLVLGISSHSVMHADVSLVQGLLEQEAKKVQPLVMMWHQSYR